MVLNRIGRSPLGVPYRSALGVLTRPASSMIFATTTAFKSYRISSDIATALWTATTVGGRAIVSNGQSVWAIRSQSNATVYSRIIDDGSEDWTTDISTDIFDAYDIDFDSSGNVWVVGDGASPFTTDIMKLDSSGTVSSQGLVSSFSQARAVRVYDASSLIIGLPESFPQALVNKVAMSGFSISWSYTEGGFLPTPVGIVLDSSGNIYVAFSRSGSGWVVKLNGSGSEQWKTQLTGMSSATDIAIDSVGNLYVSGVRSGVSGQYCAAKLNNSGTVTATNTNILADAYTIDVNPNNDEQIVIGGDSYISENLRLVDSSFTEYAATGMLLDTRVSRVRYAR